MDILTNSTLLAIQNMVKNSTDLFKSHLHADIIRRPGTGLWASKADQIPGIRLIFACAT